jgi:arylsulfatase A-like enzyme
MSRSRTALALAGAIALGGGLVAATSSGAQAACNLASAGNNIKHVVHITFDNVHLRRDNANVPSDLEQMPNLLNFILHNGTITGNHHTPLISHTATDILTALTGDYGDRMGVPVANSYGIFTPSGIKFSSSFLYWTSLSNGTAANGDGLPEMLDDRGKTHPAPWVPFTRAGCDVGAFSVANIEFESVPADVATVFGPTSSQVQGINAILAANPNDNNFAHQKARQSVNTDWLGIAVHCAQGSPLCGGPNGGPDALPDEPVAYTGFNALFGNINVAPVICATAVNPAACDAHGPTGHVKDVFGTTVIADGFGRPGFPNIFSPTAAQSLGYAAAMMEAGVPVIYAYVADAHDRNPLAIDPVTGRAANAHAFGPGEAEYVAQLKAYDQAFGAFFARLAADGITKDNTLFVVVPDENDHFVGSQPTPVGCDGVNVPCNYVFASEINAHINRLLATRNPATPAFSVHSDDAPTFYVNGNPAPTDALTRQMEHDIDALIATNPISSAVDKLSVRLADQAEMKLLHMVTKSPARTPTFTMFGDDNYFFFTAAGGDCVTGPACVFVPVSPASTFAWNHGDIQQDITRTWMAMAGPGVKREGRDDRVFSDHTDVRPTMLALVGLKDSYVHDGRVLAEKLEEHALPHGIRHGVENFIELAKAYKQLNAPLGSVGRNSLVFANRSIVADDTTYARYLATLGTVTTNRDALASQIKAVLDNAAFADQRVDEHTEDDLVRRANRIIDQVADLAGGHDHDDHGHDDHGHDDHHGH